MPRKLRTRGNQRLMKAMADPVRAMALTLLTERVASPKELAEELGEDLHKIAYHIRVLKRLECIEIVDEKKRRGATEHFYRGVSRSLLWGDYWAELSLPAREVFAASIIRNSYGDAIDAFNAGTFEKRSDRHLSRTPLLVDKEGWKDLTKLHDTTLFRVLEIQAESAERMQDGRPGIHAESVQMCFEMPEPAVKDPIGR